MDRLARAGWLSHRPERLDGQLRRAAPCRPEGWYLYHGGDGQFPGQSADEQIAAHALVAARGQSPPPSSLRRLQWYAWFWLRTEILPSQRYATASGDCRLNPPNLRRSLRVPPSPRPSLHQLRHRLPGFVRWLRRYYGGVRLLGFVHHRLRLLVFPMRTNGIPAGQTRDLPVPAQRASTHARVFDHAGLAGHSR